MAAKSSKPQGLKEIAANEHRSSFEAAPIKPNRILECPPELGSAARQEWERIVGELTAKGVLSSADRGPLASYCTAFALAMEASAMVQKHGAMIKSPMASRSSPRTCRTSISKLRS